MAVKKHIAAVLAAGIIAGCSSAPEPADGPRPVENVYEASAPMSSLHVSSSDGKLTVQVPKDWNSIPPDPSAPEILLWLVNIDYSASVTFVPIQMDPALYQTLKRDGLRAATKVSMSLKEGNVDEPIAIVLQPEPFEIEGRAYYGYEYTVNNKKTVVRVVVFDSGTQFIECACVPNAEQFSPAEQRRLFEVQHTILSSLTVK